MTFYTGGSFLPLEMESTLSHFTITRQTVITLHQPLLGQTDETRFNIHNWTVQARRF